MTTQAEGFELLIGPNSATMVHAAFRPKACLPDLILEA